MLLPQTAATLALTLTLALLAAWVGAPWTTSHSAVPLSTALSANDKKNNLRFFAATSQERFYAPVNSHREHCGNDKDNNRNDKVVRYQPK